MPQRIDSPSQSGGELALAAGLLHGGGSLKQVASALQHQFPSLSAAEALSQAKLAASAVDAGRVLGSVRPSYSVSDVNVPIERGIPTAYQYVVVAQAHLEDVESPVFRMFVIGSTERLSRQQLEQRGAELAEDVLSQSQYESRLGGDVLLGETTIVPLAVIRG